jgi:uncharacterized protein YyaL (SSP411 family)/aryl-alcohol dehydrogenase-like predicted oxidoreductase
MVDAAHRKPNRLANETSPYLLQHARNPVDWYPWGPEALGRASREDKPILLSIGYAACHWCHVMERESFENDAIADLMNRSFVCVKVDREERPDLDDIYMAATVAMSGHGGWPMTVFLTPGREPFFAGTYFPPEDKYGRPGFKTVLARIAELWRDGRDQLTQQAAELTEHVRSQSRLFPGGMIRADALDGAADELSRTFDSELGGFGGAPKFPPSASLLLLLRLFRRRSDPHLLEMVTTTLDAMKNGGIYDHLGGGFARYSTDERWLVPHFEKMLYDNAQLARVYLEAYQVTRNDEYRRVAEETLDYVVREMQGPDGGYFSATDADSEGVEGKFFVWTADEVREHLAPEAAEWFCEYYDVSPEGNWEGHSILNTPKPIAAVASELGVAAGVLARSLAESRRLLYDVRSKRVPPLTDDKVLVAWNGLMIASMAEGARVLRKARYLESAERAASFILRSLARPDGGFYRTSRAGKAHIDAYLEDYAFFADALVDLYEAGAASKYLFDARRIADRMIADFGDDGDGGAFYQTAHGHEALITRSREGHDGAIPNANAVAARLLARLGDHFDRDDFRNRALAALRAYGRAVERAPRAFATTLAVVDYLLEGPVELAFVGPASSPEMESLRSEVARHYLPNRIVEHAEVDASGRALVEGLPLLSEKTLVGGTPALYVCRDFACRAPVTRAEEVASALGEALEARTDARPTAVGDQRLSGFATAEATSKYAATVGARHGSTAYRAFGSTGLVASRLGFGCYRVDDRAPPHREALAEALMLGVNVVDTSTNYGDGHSERLVGEVLGDLARSGKVARDAVIVVSKIGYAQGRNLELVLAREQSGAPYPEVVKVADGLAHCIHPSFLSDQLDASLERLGLGTLDVCLLHNPEYFLADAAKRGLPLARAREEFYRRVTEAFRHFETEVSKGRIRYYGVSSNTSVEPKDEPEAVSVEQLVDAARAGGGDAHHFKVLQVPLNLLEVGAALEPNTGADAAESVLEHAKGRDLCVLVNRPLNAIVDGRLVRLADPNAPHDAPALSEALSTVRGLETEFEKTIAPALSVPSDSNFRPQDFFRWADALGNVAAEITSYEQWLDVERNQVAPRLMQTVSMLDRAIGRPLANRWRGFQERYLAAMEELFAAIGRRTGDRSRARCTAIARSVDPLLPEERRRLPLSQKALLVLTGLEGVTTVLVGMREKPYVADALAMMGLPTLSNALEILRAAHAVNVP